MQSGRGTARCCCRRRSATLLPAWRGAGSARRDRHRSAGAQRRADGVVGPLQAQPQRTRVRPRDRRVAARVPAAHAVDLQRPRLSAARVHRRRTRRACRSTRSSRRCWATRGCCSGRRRIGVRRSRRPKTTRRGAGGCWSGEVHDENAAALGGVAGHAGPVRIGACRGRLRAARAGDACAARLDWARRGCCDDSCARAACRAARARWRGTRCCRPRRAARACRARRSGTRGSRARRCGSIRCAISTWCCSRTACTPRARPIATTRCGACGRRCTTRWSTALAG